MLGAMMVSEGSITPVILDVRLHADDFYRDRHRTIFGAIRTLYERSEPIDALTVAEFLAQRGDLDDAGGKDTAPDPRLDRPGARQRTPLRPDRQAERAAAAPARRRADDPAVGARARGRARGAGRGRRAAAVPRRARGPRERLPPASPRSSRRRSTASSSSPRATAELTGVPSGFRDLDTITGGFQPGNLIVIAAQAGDGKVRLGHQRRRPRRVEARQARRLLLARDVGDRARAPLHRRPGADLERPAARAARSRTKDWPGVVRACNELEQAPLWIDDSSDLGMLDLRAKARRLHASRGRPRGDHHRLPAADARPRTRARTASSRSARSAAA